MSVVTVTTQVILYACFIKSDEQIIEMNTSFAYMYLKEAENQPQHAVEIYTLIVTHHVVTSTSLNGHQ